MKRILLLTVLLSLPSLHAADPPSKRGRGFFGFGAQKTEQISAGLFPQPAAESPAASDAATSSRSHRDGIFRSGQPRSVDAVSYVIQNGRKIERPIEESSGAAASEAPVAENESAPILAVLGSPADSGVETASDDGRKKRGFFAFGRRGDRDEENEVVTPVPAPDASVAPRATPAPAPPAAAPPASNDIASTTSGTAEPLDTPDFVGGTEEKNGLLGWIPFFSRNKRDAAAEAESPAPVIATARPVPAATPVATAAKPTPAAKPEAAPPKPAPAPTAVAATAPASTTFEVPRNTEAKKEEEKASSSGGGLLAPIANIRPPRKELDLSDAVTIIQDGEIVAGSETNFEAAPEPATGDRPQAPQIVNGVKTYASWDDVTARSSSAADKIIRSMR